MGVSHPFCMGDLGVCVCVCLCVSVCVSVCVCLCVCLCVHTGSFLAASVASLSTHVKACVCATWGQGCTGLIYSDVTHMES